MYCFVNVPKIQIIKMKNKKHLLGNMCCAQTGCYHIFAYNKKKVSVSGRLALSGDLQRLCSLVLFSYQGGRVQVCGRFCSNNVCLHTLCRHLKKMQQQSLKYRRIWQGIQIKVLVVAVSMMFLNNLSECVSIIFLSEHVSLIQI